MKVLGNGFVFSLLAAAILAFATAEVSAAFVKKEELDRGDVEAPVEAAVEDLAGDQVALNRIVAVYQPTQTNLKENSKTVQNIALIYASLSQHHGARSVEALAGWRLHPDAPRRRCREGALPQAAGARAGAVVCPTIGLIA
jgi:hypothetical protein